MSPPDAVAATTILSRLNMPRNLVTILEGESLVNDASGLGIYKLAMQNDLLVSMSHKARNFALEHCFEKEFELRTEAINAALASTPARNRIVQQAI